MKIQDISLNLFNKEIYSDRGLVEFCFNVNNMYSINNSTGKYTVRMGSMSNKLLPFSQLKTGIFIDIGTQKGRTLAVENFLSDLLINIREQERFVVYIAQGKDTKMYTEIFPQGLTIFNKLTRDSVRMLIDHLVAKGEKYSAELGTNFKTIFETAKTEYNQLRGDQKDAINEVATKVANKDQLREELTIELTSQYLLFCSENVNNRDYVLKFFKFSIFTKHQRHHRDFLEIKAEVGANETLTIYDKMKITDIIEIVSQADHLVTFCGSNDADSICTRGIAVPARATIKCNYSSIANNGDEFFKVTNTDLEKSAKFIIRIFDK